MADFEALFTADKRSSQPIVIVLATFSCSYVAVTALSCARTNNGRWEWRICSETKLCRARKCETIGDSCVIEVIILADFSEKINAANSHEQMGGKFYPQSFRVLFACGFALLLLLLSKVPLITAECVHVDWACATHTHQTLIHIDTRIYGKGTDT